MDEWLRPQGSLAVRVSSRNLTRYGRQTSPPAVFDPENRSAGRSDGHLLIALDLAIALSVAVEGRHGPDLVLG